MHTSTVVVIAKPEGNGDGQIDKQTILENDDSSHPGGEMEELEAECIRLLGGASGVQVMVMVMVMMMVMVMVMVMEVAVIIMSC